MLLLWILVADGDGQLLLGLQHPQPRCLELGGELLALLVLFVVLQFGSAWMLGWSSLALLAIIVGTASLAYYLATGGRYSAMDCLYMSVITVSTVGYNEVIPVDTLLLRGITIFLIIKTCFYCYY